MLRRVKLQLRRQLVESAKQARQTVWKMATETSDLTSWPN